MIRNQFVQGSVEYIKNNFTSSEEIKTAPETNLLSTEMSFPKADWGYNTLKTYAASFCGISAYKTVHPDWLWTTV